MTKDPALAAAKTKLVKRDADLRRVGELAAFSTEWGEMCPCVITALSEDRKKAWVRKPNGDCAKVDLRDLVLSTPKTRTIARELQDIHDRCRATLASAKTHVWGLPRVTLEDLLKREGIEAEGCLTGSASNSKMDG